MEFNVPQSNTEAILQNELGAENELEPSQSRIEELLLYQMELLKNIAKDLATLSAQLGGLSFRAVTEEPETPAEGTVYIITTEEEE